jgi:predicted CopG family antitoxin
MRRKLTISVDDQVYRGLHQVVGRHHISQFIESLVRLLAAYRDMAADSGDRRS